jgi:protein SCO1/2
VVVALLAMVAAAPVQGQRGEPLPAQLEGVGIEERLGAQVPLELVFTAEDGRRVALGELITGQRPVLLTLVYYRCPMLCGLVLNGLVEALQEVSLTAGKDFDIVTVSIDPLETATLARLKKQSLMREYGRPEAAAGWHFLTGDELSIRALAEAVGFGYRWVEERKEYAHAAAVMVLTPQGKVSRYLYGVLYEPRTVRLALAEARVGTLATVADRFLLYCFHYDANQGRFVVAARNIMRLGGLVTAGVVAVWLGRAWWGRGGRRAAAGATGGA